MAEEFMTKAEVEELLKDKFEIYKMEVDCLIRSAKENATSVVLSRLDDIRAELKESQKNQGERIGELEKERTKMGYEIQHFKEGMEHNNSMLDKIDEKLDKCITTDNLEEKLQRPLQEIKDSVVELKVTPDKKKSEWIDKVIWAIAGIVLASIVGLVLKSVGLT